MPGLLSPRITCGKPLSDRSSNGAAARVSSSGWNAPSAHSCPRTSLNSIRRQLWLPFGTSPPLACQLRQQRYPARPVTASATAAASATSDPEPRSSPWPQIRKLALTAGCCIAWLYVASTFQSSGPFAAISLGFRSAAQTGLRGAFFSGGAGFGAGVLHTLAGADHLAALTPLTFGHGYMKASMLGALWGLGHSTGQLILGLLMVILKDRFDSLVPALSRWGGVTVGLSLIAIGVTGLLELRQDLSEAASLAHQPQAAAMGAGASGGAAAQGLTAGPQASERKCSTLGTFVTGVLYGLQPDALFVVIPALTLPTKMAAAAYCLMFVFGTVAAMGGYAAVIGATSKVIKERNTWLTTNLNVMASCVAVFIGATVLVSGCQM